MICRGVNSHSGQYFGAAGNVRCQRLCGTANKAPRPDGSQQFGDEAGAADERLTLHDRYFHDLLNDLGKERMMDDMIAWMEARRDRPPGAAAGMRV